MAVAYLLLGSNIEPERHLNAAAQALTALGVITKQSSLYHTEPLGIAKQDWFLNQVVVLQTNLTPPALLQRLKMLEKILGRQTRHPLSPREIDLDILLYNSVVLDSVSLHIPHLGLPKRRFALVPLTEVAADAIDPRSGKLIYQLLADCSDHLSVIINMTYAFERSSRKQRAPFPCLIET